VIWSVTAFTLEIPSGAWADAFSRRRLLVLGGLLRAVGFASWVLWPTYAGFALGFVLWGICSATSSGTQEALVYDELAAVGGTGRYVAVVGRAETIALVSMLLAGALAAPAYAVGGYGLLGAASVAVSLGTAAVALSFPETPRVNELDGDSGLRRYLASLRAGLVEVRRDRRVWHAVLIASAVSGLPAVDEYLPLLARALGASTVAVPLWLVLPTAAMAVASAFADRFGAAAPSRVAAGLAVAALLLAAGALSGHPDGMLPVAVCFAMLQIAMVLTGARMQQVISGPSRATVLSVGGFGAEVFAVTVYAGFALGFTWFSVVSLVAALAVPLLILAALTARWLPSADPQNRADHELRGVDTERT
jgi:hypothetical protein